ncbi:hypothetical protein ATEIFO6365_0012011600 [Aspergillus terreus]|uniref:Uncharacterized protein n=1 Tax=Aspergillus terreus TaxID=33178 RepID=A0A5M3ZE22_ASPTE|nr:hypothetical protein ATETN484_0013012600 [Aspergillus terreus]GFF20360.1 hypothetical protein ATEIFO6365_0012011600 [Aspergillus terreus]
MDANQSQPPGQRPDQIPIAQLSPGVENLSRCSIHATVSLLWPYSSSTQSLGLLLAEPDFRLRRSNGQVKVIFHGHIAESVAASKLGIGDYVFLSLDGARFVDNQATTQTPGKCVTWDLHFDDRVLLEVFRASERLSTVKVDRPSSPVPNIRVTSPTPVTPKNISFQGEIPSVTHAESWQSPAFVGRSRTSFGALVDSAFDPFAEEDGYVPGKGRKRTRFSMRNNDWRIIDEPEVPGEDDMPLDWAHIFDEAEISSDGDKDESTDAALPAPTDTMEVVSTDIDIPMTQSSPGLSQDVAHTNQEETSRQPEKQPFPDLSAHLPIHTPRLNPIPSPGLPIPSPLLTAPSSQGYFESVEVTSHTHFEPVASKLSQELPKTTNETSQSLGEGEKHSGDNGTAAFTEESLKISTASQALEISEPIEATERIVEDTASTGTTNPSEVNAESGVIEAVNVEPREESDVQELHDNVHGGDASEESGKGEEEEAESPDSEFNEVQIEDESQDRRNIGSGFAARDHGSANMPEVIESDSDEESEVAESLEDFETTEHRNIRLGDRTVSDERDEFSSQNGADEDKNEYLDEDEDGYENYGDDDADEDNIGEEEYYRVGSGDEEVQSIDENEYDGRVESEVESDQMSVEDGIQPSQSPKTGPPEVIVLDSDSEDEAPPYYQISHFEQSHIPTLTQRRQSPAASEEGSFFDGSESASGMDDWSEEDESQTNDEIGPEREERRPDTESIEGEEIEHRASESVSVGDQWPEDENMEGQTVGDEQEDEQMGYSFAEQQPSSRAKEPSITLIEHDGEGSAVQESQHIEDDSAGVSTAGSALLPLQHGELDYASPAHPSNHTTPPVTSDHPLAIDPELYSSTPVQEEVGGETDQAFPEHQSQGLLNEGPSLNDTEQVKEDKASKMAFSLDGAVPSQLSPEPHNAISGVPFTLPHGPRIMTPNVSQLSDEPAHVDIITGEPLPTPVHTQETLPRAHDISEPARTADSAPALSAKESSPVLEETGEGTVFDEIPQKEQQQAIEETSVHNRTEGLVAQDEALQPQRHEDTDSIGTMDSVHLLSVDRHYPGLRSKLSYFAPLATLIDHFGALTDTLSVVSEVRPIIRATSGKKDYLLTLQLTDPSMAGTALNAEIFRPYKGALPSPEEGDAILLRNFMVRSFNHSMVLVSVETSSWAVFNSSRVDAQVDGPPVEYGAEEQAHATDLRQWYQETGMAMVADNQLQASIERASREQTPASSAVFSDSGSPDSLLRDNRAGSSVSARGARRGRKSRRRITIHELRDGTRYTEVGSPSGKDSIHELRDGTVYANL